MIAGRDVFVCKPLQIGNADGIGRLLKEGAADEVVVCAVMLLINCYVMHDLEMFGGVDYQQIWRHWNHIVSPEGEGFLVTAEPTNDTARTKFISKIVGSMGDQVNGKDASHVFWKAFDLLKGTGLFYEVVTSISIDGERTPIRVNDFHAVGADSSLLEAACGLGVGFYVHKDNDRSEPEGCWFYLPSDPEKVIGIWRLRFRCATPETARGVELDWSRVDDAIAAMCAKGVLYSG